MTANRNNLFCRFMAGCWFVFAAALLVSVTGWAGAEYYEPDSVATVSGWKIIALASGYLAGAVLVWNVVCHELRHMWTHKL